ncbi:MAG: efflux RND transporter permease subunit [Spirochaetaceae bacterium]|jgi:multidrug efflux pump subunit AcrB|nr:efflux RND transporter permease subunit [Spirochaetaceae bacterium]
MKSLICFFVNRPVATSMTLGAVFLAAVIFALKLPLDVLPEIGPARIAVETNYSGLGAEDVRLIITTPVEDALSSLKGLERIRSVSRDGSSLVMLDFRWGTDSGRAALLVREAVDAVYPNLPQNVEKPSVRAAGAFMEPHAVIAVFAKNGDAVFERDFAEYELRTRLRRIDGVGIIVLSGGEEREIKVAVDLQRAAPQGFDVNGLALLVNGEIAETPAGTAKDGDREVIINSSGKPKKLRDIQYLNLSGNAGPFLLNDLAYVKMGNADPKSIWAFNGKKQTALEIWRQEGADPIALSVNIKKMIDEASKTFGRDVEAHIVYDKSPEIMERLKGLIVSGIFGSCAVFLTLCLFMRNIRTSVLAAISIPVAAAVSIIAVKLCGKTLNSMTLSGIMLGIGLVSDTSVVILDSLCRVFYGRPTGKKNDLKIAGGENLENGVSNKIAECAAALSASSFGGAATTVIVFLPVMFLPGALGELFGDLAVTLIASVIAGWLYAQLILPSLFGFAWRAGACGASRKFILPNKGRFKARLVLNQPLGKDFLDVKYARAVDFACRHPKIVLFSAAFFSAAGVLLLASRPVVFRTPESAGSVIVKAEYPAGTSMEKIGEEAVRISGSLKESDFIEKVTARAGAEYDDVLRRSEFGFSNEELFLQCTLKRNVNVNEAVAETKNILAKENFDTFNFPKISIDIPEDAAQKLLGVSSGRRLAVKGMDPKQTAEYVNKFIDEIRFQSAGVLDDIRLDPDGEKQELRITPNREAAAMAGVTSWKIAESIGSTTKGVFLNDVEFDGKPVKVRFSGIYEFQNENMLRKVKSIPILLDKGVFVLLDSVATVDYVKSPRVFARMDRSDMIYITMHPVPGSEKKLDVILDNIINKTPYISKEDESVFIKYNNSVLLTIILVLVLLYMTMGAQFESFILPFVFMLAIPFSVSGAGLALFASSSFLDSGAVIALVALFGLVVNNAIVLYEAVCSCLNHCDFIENAVKQAAKERFRAVLITTFTTVAVLTPLIISPEAQSERAMAVTMLGGCLTASLLTLFALPPVFLKYFMAKKKGMA